MIFRPSRKLVYSLICMFAFAGFTSQSTMADIVGTDALIAEQTASMARAHIDSVLERQDVQNKLVEYGVSPEEAAARVAALTDQETMELAQKIESLPAGGDIVLLLVVVILILLLR